MRYLDTGSRQPEATLWRWLSEALVDLRYFTCQTGYFSKDGLAPFVPTLTTALKDGAEVHLVLGANEDSLQSVDLEFALDLVEPYAPRGSIVVVSAPDVLIHPKTFYIETKTSRKRALIGSANLTYRGLGDNVEACIALDSEDDPKAPFADIRAAIDIWRAGKRLNALSVRRSELPRLIAEGIIDRPRPVAPRLPGSVPRTGKPALFPPLGALVPRSRSGGASSRRTISLPHAGPVLSEPTSVLVKRLSSLDTKGFRGEGGTAYIALPTIALSKLTTVPFGKNHEPRVNTSIDARLDTVPSHIISSGGVDTNITAVGFGKTPTSHKDLRLNILKVIVLGIEHVAAAEAQQVPTEGDLAVIELPAPGLPCRLTFVTTAELKADLAPYMTEKRGTWGWLPPPAFRLPWPAP